MPKSSQERSDDMSWLVIEEIRLKSYIDNFHTKHIAFKASIAKREDEYDSMEARYRLLAEEGAKERKEVRVEQEKVLKRSYKIDRKLLETEEELKMLRLQLTDWEIRTQISRTKIKYVCDSIDEDKTRLRLLAQQMAAEVTKLKEDALHLDKTNELEALKMNSFLRLCGLVEANWEQVYQRWLAIWPLLNTWQRVAKLSSPSVSACNTLESLYAETAALRSCIMRLDRLPALSHNESDLRAYARADGTDGDVSAPLRQLCSELQADLLEARSRTDKLRALLRGIQQWQRRNSEALSALRGAVEADLASTAAKVQAEIVRAAGAYSQGGFAAFLKTSLLTESAVQSPVGSESWKWYREIKIAPSKQMDAIYSSARAESICQLDTTLAAAETGSPAAKMSLLKTIIGSLEVRACASVLQAAVERAHRHAEGSADELVAMVTSPSDEPLAVVAAHEAMQSALKDAKAVFFDFKLYSLISSQLTSALGLLPPETQSNQVDKLSCVLQYVRTRREMGNYRPLHRHDVAEAVNDMTYSARHASVGYKKEESGDEREGGGGKVDLNSKNGERQQRKSERRNRSTLFSTLFRSSVVLPQEDVLRYLEREEGSRLVSTSMTRLSGMVAHITYYFNDNTDVLKVHAAIAPDLNYFLFLSQAQTQEFFSDDPRMGNLSPDSVDSCLALTRRLSIETYSTSFVQRLLTLCRETGMLKACADVEAPDPSSSSYAPCALLALRTLEKRSLFAFGLPGQLLQGQG